VTLDVLQHFLFEGLDHVVLAVEEILDGGLAVENAVVAVNAGVVLAGIIQSRFLQCLGGQGAGVDTGAAVALFLLDDRDLFAKIGGFGGGFFAGWAGTENDQVILVCCWHATGG
jgi:hypothetical protein